MATLVNYQTAPEVGKKRKAYLNVSDDDSMANGVQEVLSIRVSMENQRNTPLGARERCKDALCMRMHTHTQYYNNKDKVLSIYPTCRSVCMQSVTDA